MDILAKFMNYEILIPTNFSFLKIFFFIFVKKLIFFFLSSKF